MFKQIHRPLKDAYLQAKMKSAFSNDKISDHIPMQAIPIPRLPGFPDINILPYGPISTTGNVAEYTVEIQRSRIRTTCFRWLGYSDSRIIRSVEIRNHQGRAWQASRLMNEEMRAFAVAVIGDE